MSAVEQLLADRETGFPAKLLEAREILLKEIETNPTEAYPKLTEVLFWLGDYSTDNESKEKYFGEGVEHGKKAVEAAPNSAAAHLWYASNMGNHGLIRGIMSSLFYLGPIEKHGKRAMELDEAYFHAAPLRLVGRFFHQAPSWPIGNGDSKKALEILEKAVKVAPDFGYNLVYLADLQISRGKKDEAKKLIEQALALPADPQMKIMHDKMLAEARKLQEKL